MRSNFSDRWTDVLPSDPRSIAVARIGLGALLLIDCIQRAAVLPDFYTDSGVVPRATAVALWYRAFPNSLPTWSLNALDGSYAWQAALLLLELLAALAFAIGYRTRIASIAAFVLFLSHCQRNVLVCHAQDWALLAFLLWAIFVPLDRTWAVRPTAPPPPSRAHALQIAPLAFTAQLVMLLFFAGMQKLLNSEAWVDGEALAIVLRSDLGVSGFGRWIGALPPAIPTTLTYSVLLAEIVVPWLLVAPVSPRLRTAAVAFIALHLLGFAACLKVGLLPLVVLSALFSRIPGAFWNAVGLRPSSARSSDRAAPRREPTWTIAIAAAGILHALLLNLFRLSGEYTGPAWLDSASGFLVPRQGWRMFSTADPSWRSSWTALLARRAGDGAIVRLPDAGAPSFAPESSAEELHGSFRWRLVWSNSATLHRDFPEILTRTLEGHCKALALVDVELVAVQREGNGFSRSPIGRYRCGASSFDPPLGGGAGGPSARLPARRALAPANLRLSALKAR